ncbi:hexosaminidase D-like isoform X2 [Varroa jacobsoni]|uniref:beta-N-acetylhexosaminidase n=1 Tax=Varroa destructor TaxID=109461 RepID=A0A7M7K7R4_VARDE|nr:hexosaminidase D-like isoform X2 [Varroa destructor]XP_022695353.1 hexosaminidase D-like isoform X2 [Varroa jacobsoni]
MKRVHEKTYEPEEAVPLANDASTSRTAGVSSGLSEKIDGDGIHRRPIRSGTRGLLTEEAGGMWLTAASRYVSHQLIMSAWRRKPVVLFTILAVTLLVLFVQYSQVVGEPRTPRIGSASANGNNNGFKDPEPPMQSQIVGYNAQPQQSQHQKLTAGGNGPDGGETNGAQADAPSRNAGVSQDKRQMYPSGPLPEPYTAPPGAPLHRIVHFDLKGAPPKISYIKKVLPIIQQAGATGVMLEYEDMFPYSGSLEFIRAGNAYKMAELEELLRYITVDLKLHLIPLIQTFGHLEFVLKFDKYRHLREMDEFPAVICPSKNESFNVIKEMARQMMALHSKFHVRYLHIGCDEVFHLGECTLCSMKSKEELLLGHMSHVAEFVRKELQVIPLVWDDMMRNYSPEQLRRYRLHDLVEPMVWTYVKDVYRFIPYSNWITFGEVFPHIWAASAFKGAFGETLTVPSAKGHLENNVAWVDVIEEQKSKFHGQFRGLVITGWQRYDHFATLAETFPAGFPSLILSLVSVTAGGYAGREQYVRMQMSKLLNCHEPIRRLDLEADEYLWNSVSRCMFPGANVFRMTENHRDAVKHANEYYDGVTIHKAWLTPYNVRRNYTFIDRIDQGLEEYPSVFYSVALLSSQARDALREVFDEYTVAEWIEQNIYPTVLKLEKLKADAESLRKARTWPKRPLPINPNLQRFGVGRTEL